MYKHYIDIRKQLCVYVKYIKQEKKNPTFFKKWCYFDLALIEIWGKMEMVENRLISKNRSGRVKETILCWDTRVDI